MQAVGMVDRVSQEVSIHARLKHPAILELYTCFEDTNYVYLVLELCHNGELQRFLKTQGTKALSEQNGIQISMCNKIYICSYNKSYYTILAAHIIRQVVQGLLYLHSHQILHRDLSLSNLLLTRDMQVVWQKYIYIYILYSKNFVFYVTFTENCRFWISHTIK